MRFVFVFCGLILLTACASDDPAPARGGRHGKHHRSGDPAASGTPGLRDPKPVSVPPGTVTNSPELHQGAVDAMGTPST